jgi:hypothetical protein
MTSEVSICNMALSRNRVTQRIASLSDPNERARVCNLWYTQCRDELLSQFPWAFAMRNVALAELTDDPPPGWGYVYRYPTDCVRARMVTTEDGARRSVSTPLFEQSMLNLREFLPNPIPFQVMSDDSGRIIVTDLEDAYLWYTKKITDPNQFDPLFVSLLVWRLAVELGPALEADMSVIQAANRGYALAVTQAEAADLNEMVPDRRPDSQFVTVR